MDKFKKLLKFILIVIVILIILFNIVLIYKAHNNKGEMPDFLGYTPYIIISGSMEPKIPVNTVIVTKKVNENKIQVGDIVSYKPKDKDIIVTHRIVKMIYTDNTILYELKGDNNKYSDEYFVIYSQIKGKYLFKIPFVGKIVNLARTPQGIVIIFSFIIATYIIYYVISNDIDKSKRASN